MISLRHQLIVPLSLWLVTTAAFAQDVAPVAPDVEPEAAAPAPTDEAALEEAEPAEASSAAEEPETREGEAVDEDEGAGEDEGLTEAEPVSAEATERGSGPPPRPAPGVQPLLTPSTESQSPARKRNAIANRGAEIEGELADARSRLAGAQSRLRELERTKREEPAAIRDGDRTSAEAKQLQATAQTALKEYRQLYADAQAGQDRAGEFRNAAEDYGRQYPDLRDELGEQLANADALMASWRAMEGVGVRGADTAASLSSAIVAAQEYARERSPWRRADNWISTKTATHIVDDLASASLSLGRAVTTDFPQWLRDFGARLATIGGVASYTVRLIACGLLCFAGFYGWEHLLRFAQREAGATEGEEPVELSAAASATLGIVRALIILIVGAALIWLCRFPEPWLRFLMSLLAVLTGAALLENVSERLLSPAEPERRVVPARDEHAVHLHRTFRGFIVFSGVLLPLLIGLRTFPYERTDVLAAVDFTYGLASWLYLFALVVPFGGPRALIPDRATVATSIARRTAVATSSAVLVLGALMLVVHAAGYTNLSQLLARAVPVAILAVTAAWILHRTYVAEVERRLAALSTEDSQSADLRVFGRAARPLLGVVERLGMIALAGVAIVRLGGVPRGQLGELSAALSKPLFTVEDTDISTWAIASAMLAVVVSILVSRIIREMLQGAASLRRQYDAGQRYAISSVVYYVLVVIAVLWAVRLSGLSLGALTVFAGVAGIGLAFGLQDIIKNFISGIILLVEQPVKVGDFIDMGDVRGLVTQISIRSTTVRTLGNVFVIVPNADFVTQRVLNLSHRDLKLRLDIDVGVSYGSDVELVRSVLQKVGEDHPLTLNDPPPSARLMGFGDSSVDFRLLTWIADPRHQEPTTSELNFAVWHALQEHGIQIPFPQRDVHIRSDATFADRRALRPERTDESPPEDA
jgi:small-conductance mechanosensitive channel